MSTTEVSTLRASSEARLRELEEAIERGLTTFIEVGRALIEIAEFKLYLLAGYPNFPAYTERRWGLSRNAAYRKVYAVRVVDALGEGITLPQNETQANALAPLLKQPVKLREAWTEANATTVIDGITSKHVRAAVNKRLDRVDGRTREGRPPRMVKCPECGHEFRADRDHAAPIGVVVER